MWQWQTAMGSASSGPPNRVEPELAEAVFVGFCAIATTVDSLPLESQLVTALQFHSSTTHNLSTCDRYMAKYR